jgi:hypothetical protein
MKPSVIVWDLETVPDRLRSRQRPRRQEGRGHSRGPRQPVPETYLPHHRVHRSTRRSPREQAGAVDSSAIERAADLTGAGPGQQPMTHQRHRQQRTQSAIRQAAL